MKTGRVLLIMTCFVLLLAFSGGQKATATPNTTEISDECKAEITAVLRNCSQTCGRDLRCYIRCVINNYPACLQ
jgi:hypothetical protein